MVLRYPAAAANQRAKIQPIETTQITRSRLHSVRRATCGPTQRECRTHQQILYDVDSSPALSQTMISRTAARPRMIQFEDVYLRLKAMAGKQLSKTDKDTINTTGLVHELYLKMNQGKSLRFDDEYKFFDYAAKAMRHVLVDRARTRLRSKRGGDNALRLDLDADTEGLVDMTAESALHVDRALSELETQAPRAAKIVELHFFAGLQLDEIARHMQISLRTVSREWRAARAFLHGVMP
ncbi:MAG: sigma-70 family RNA polymerase sigma factor [Rhodanobacteraceae bacterium]|nr:sigma-70 family RNA polymerase sigma factor [Rhodanobacteraceae bacterium]